MTDYEYATYAVANNNSPEGPYRVVVVVTAVMAHGGLMDLIATKLDLEPADVRRVNYVRKEQMPYRSVTGHPYESGDYESALEALDYAGLRAEQERLRGEGLLVGVGIGSYVEYTG